MIQPPNIGLPPLPPPIAAPAPVQKQAKSPSRDRPLTSQAIDAVEEAERGLTAERRRRKKGDQLDVTV